MKRFITSLIIVHISLLQHGQIIADHSVVDKYDDIPQYYIDQVKKMWLTVPGESHSQAYRVGLLALETLNPVYAASVIESGTPEPYTASNLRASRATWGSYRQGSTGWVYLYGEQDWFTSAGSIAQTKAGITYCNTHGLNVGAIGFGWCYDPDINYTNINTYLSATQEYIEYCRTNDYSTEVFFTTGPIDGTSYTNSGRGGAYGYNIWLRYEAIRDYVALDETRILFDYSDILSHDASGTKHTLPWNGNTYEVIAPENLGGTEVGHIGTVGAIRLAKAMWWMLARMAGWDGVSGTEPISVSGITVTGAGGSTQITTDNGTLQLTATATPANATNKTVTWSIVNGTGQATIHTTGLVTAVSNGTVTARATANDGSGVVGSLVITISSQVIPVTGIAVTGAGGSTQITTDNGTLQLTATAAPANATNKTVTWSIVNGTGQATINTTGLVTAVSNGTVTARATANDGSGVVGSLVITISSQVIPVTVITVSGAGGSTSIPIDNGTLQLTATVAPANATNKNVTWSIVNGTGQATINTTGLVTAVSNGTVTARATANDGSGVVGSLVITISSQVIPVTVITVTGAGGSTQITTDNSTLQLTATVAPANATNKNVTWSIVNGTGQATINTTGLVTAVSNGTVTARATANDGSGVVGSLVISISNQFVAVTGISVSGYGSTTTIETDDGTLQMVATVTPSNASNKSIKWSLVSGNGHASISDNGILTARSNGTVTVRATANDGSGTYGEVEIIISNQIVPVSSIRVKPKTKSASATAVEGTLQLETEVLPIDATTQTVEWSVINMTGQATIDEKGFLTGTVAGEVIVMASATDGSGVIGELSVTIQLAESIKITYNRHEVKVLVPNALTPAKASIHNLYGTHIKTKVVDTDECTFDISGLSPGIYVVSVYNSVVQDAVKIVIAY